MPRREIEPVDPVPERRVVEPLAAAARARVVRTKAREEHAHVHLVRARLEPCEPRAKPGVLSAAPLALAVDDHPPVLLGEHAPGTICGDRLALRELRQNLALPCRRFAGPRTDGALLDRQT